MASHPDQWIWCQARQNPILGSLAGVAHWNDLWHYLEHRDISRASRNAPSKWAGTSTRHAAHLWATNSSTLSTRAHQARHLWDLRWHGENVRVATVHAEAATTCCPLCQGPHTQTHVLCDCPRLGPERRAVFLDLHLATHRYPPGPQRILATAYNRLLQDESLGDARGQLWTGLWPQHHREVLLPALRACTLKESKTVLTELGRITVKAVDPLWTRHLELAGELLPEPDPFSAIRDPPDTASDADIDPDPLSPPSDITLYHSRPQAYPRAPKPHGPQPLTATTSKPRNHAKRHCPGPPPPDPGSAQFPLLHASNPQGPSPSPTSTALTTRSHPPPQQDRGTKRALCTTSDRLWPLFTAPTTALPLTCVPTRTSAKRNRPTITSQDSDTDNPPTPEPHTTTVRTHWTHPLTRPPLRPSAKRLRPSPTAANDPSSQPVPALHITDDPTPGNPHCSDLVTHNLTPTTSTGHKRHRNPPDCAVHHAFRPAPFTRQSHPELTQQGRPTTTTPRQKRPSEQLAPPPDKRQRVSPTHALHLSASTARILVQPDPPPRRIWDPRLGDDDG
jgi:hypothetical protein